MTKSAKQKKEGIGKDKVLLVSLVVILLIFLGLFIILKNQAKAPPAPPDIKTFNGFTFQKIDNIWTSQIIVSNKFSGKQERYSIMFHFTPDEVENITTEKNSRNESSTPSLFLNIPLVYITTEPNYPGSVVLGGVEISKVMAIVSKSYQERMQIKSAMTKKGNYSFPIATCENITATQRVIYLKLGNETRIDFVNGCTIVQGTDEKELLRASERLAFEILRIL